MSAAHPQVVADRYRLVEPLGQGGMGRVWRARDELLHRDVAIKELVPPIGLTADERQEMRERTLREARAIARLSHPNVVRIFDILRTDGDPWIVMEYVPSRSLQDVLANDGPLPPKRVAEIGLGMLAALRAAHRAGMVHRDVKPGNVLLGDDGRVVLTDFGLATIPGDPVVTRTGLVLGSPAYIAPERAHDGTAEPAADMWSLGATLYAAVEGQSPYARPSAIATLAALATEPPAPARHGGPLKPLFNGLLRKDPAQRIGADEAERLLLRAAGRRPRSARSLLGARRSLADQRRPSPARSLPVAAGPPVAVAPAVVLPAPAGPAEPEPAQPAPEPAPPAPEPAPPAPEPARPAPEPAPPAPEPAESAPEPAQPAPEPAAVDAAPAKEDHTVREPAADSVPATGRAAVPVPGNGPWAKRLLGIAAALVAAALLLVAVLTSGDDGEPGAGPPASPSPAATATRAPTTAAPTASGPPAGQPPAVAPPPPSPLVLPPGWRIYKDRTGFSVAAPNWPISREGTIVYFREPRGQHRVLGIDQSGKPKPDPVADWTNLETRRLADGDWPGYKRIRIEWVDYFDGAADWEYTYDGGSGRLHVLNRGFIASDHQAHAIFWLTPDATWTSNKDEFQLIARSFRPIP
ncbi:MAG TPA: serine/threonine-protein kinase [Pilimelia sp.]|nr:serine/threonine-protein kinase [Pilimelia sp.]